MKEKKALNHKVVDFSNHCHSPFSIMPNGYNIYIFYILITDFTVKKSHEHHQMKKSRSNIKNSHRHIQSHCCYIFNIKGKNTQRNNNVLQRQIRRRRRKKCTLTHTLEYFYIEQIFLLYVEMKVCICTVHRGKIMWYTMKKKKAV